MATIGKYGKIIFSDQDVQFIKDNFHKMTNDEIATALGLKKTIVRTKAYELGLKRMELEYWPPDAIEFLKNNYHKIGDCEIVRLFAGKFPKQKGWSTRHIQKKMDQLNLKRNKMDWFLIKERNRRNGSYGKMNPKNTPATPKVYFYLNQKTRIEVKPGKTIRQLQEKYKQL